MTLRTRLPGTVPSQERVRLLCRERGNTSITVEDGSGKINRMIGANPAGWAAASRTGPGFRPHPNSMA